MALKASSRSRKGEIEVGSASMAHVVLLVLDIWRPGDIMSGDIEYLLYAADETRLPRLAPLLLLTRLDPSCTFFLGGLLEN